MLKTIAVWTGSISHRPKSKFRAKTKPKKNHLKRAIRDPTWFFTKMNGNSTFSSNERNYAKLALAMGSGSRTWDKGVSEAARNILCPKCALELAAIQKTKQRYQIPITAKFDAATIIHDNLKQNERILRTLRVSQE